MRNSSFIPALLGAVAGAVPLAPLPAIAADEPETFDAIIVTAQRREQRLQDVGISVTALGSESLKDLDITEATDITKAVPNLRMNAYSSSQVVFNIRGVSQNDYGDEKEPPVAVYQDDSYSSSINLASFPVFDLARVEVLRGPQGTLFGRNATGGALQFISNKPTKEFEGYATATYGRYDQQIYEGAVSGPLTENLQGRLAAIRDRDTGYIKSIIPGQPDRGANDHYALRGILAWQPTDLVNVQGIFRFLRADRERQAGLYSVAPACPNGQFQGEFTQPTQECELYGTNPGETGTGYLNPRITPSFGGDPWASAETQASYVDRKIFGSQLHVDWTLGEVSFVSITDYQHSEKFYLEGGDASPEDGVLFYQGSKLDQLSQEFRASMQFGPHQLTTGLYGMRVSGDYTGKFADPFVGYDPTESSSQDTKSYAIFAQDEWALAERFKLITGVRYWHDKREGAYFAEAPDAPGLTGPVTIIFNRNQIFPDGSAQTPSDAIKKFNGVTARLELDFKPVDNVLLYGSYNRGSKSGGFTFSTGTPYDVNAVPFLDSIPFKPEKLNAYELGVKSTLTDRTTLNASAFYYDYNNYQAFAQVGTVQSIFNLDAHEAGLEVELNSQPLDGVTLQVGGSYLNSTVKNVLLPDGSTVVNHDMPQTPKFSGNALARYEHPLAGGTASVQVNGLYSDQFCFTVLCAPVEREGSYFVADSRIGFEPGGGHWEFAGFVNNMFERKYRVYAFDSSLFAGVVAGVYAKPRTWGVSATYRFGAAH